MRICFVNYASGGWYPLGQKRLEKSIRDMCFRGDFKAYTSCDQLGCQAHNVVPYGFKPAALVKVRSEGYDMAIYCDASIWAVKNFDALLGQIERDGWYMEYCGHWAGTWCKDDALKTLEITREEAFKIPLFTAGFIGLYFHNEIANKFLDEWYRLSKDGITFQGTWDNKNGIMSKDPRVLGHRHDLLAASIVAHKLKMKIGDAGTRLAYIGPGYAKPKDTVMFYLKPC